MCILELCKVLICRFHYGCIKKKYDEKTKLLFTGTDSLMYHPKTEYFYEISGKFRRILALGIIKKVFLLSQ